MRCLRNVNGGRMYMRLNGEPLEDVDFLSTWGRNWPRMKDMKVMWYTK